MHIVPFNKPDRLAGRFGDAGGAARRQMAAICAMVLALAMTGCALPKIPPGSAAADKSSSNPSMPSARLDAIEATQAALKSRQDAQESALLSMQEHIALLDSRLDMIEYSLGIGKGSPHLRLYY